MSRPLYRRVSLILHNRCLIAIQAGGVTADEAAVLTKIVQGWHGDFSVTKADRDAALAILARQGKTRAAHAPDNGPRT